MTTKTSATHPIRVDFVPDAAHGLPGRIGMTFAPGKKASGIDGRWERDLDADLARLRAVYGATVLVSLVEEHELAGLGIPDLVARAEAAGIAVLRLSIVDGGTPAEGAAFAALVAACLVALGHAPDRAVETVRRARPGAVETAAQERYVAAFAAR